MVNKVEYDDDVYKAIVTNKDSQEQYLYIDPATATTVPAPKQSAKEINMSQAISRYSSG